MLVLALTTQIQSKENSDIIEPNQPNQLRIKVMPGPKGKLPKLQSDEEIEKEKKKLALAAARRRKARAAAAA